jgi:hypothetical protein
VQEAERAAVVAGRHGEPEVGVLAAHGAAQLADRDTTADRTAKIRRVSGATIRSKWRSAQPRVDVGQAVVLAGQRAATTTTTPARSPRR